MIKNTPSFPDFLNPLLISNFYNLFQYQGEYNSENYFICDDWNERIIDGPEVQYRINKDGFRSNHFMELKKENFNVLYGGCSWTFGEGLPEEMTWTYQVTEGIKKIINKNVIEYNTGFMGSSIDLIIKNTMSFIRLYGKPDIIFLCFPDIGRKIKYSEQSYQIFNRSPHWFKTKNKEQRRYLLDYKKEDNLLYFSLLINLFEDYCEKSEIKLVWSNWVTGEVDSFGEYKNFKFVDTEKLLKAKHIDSLPYWEFACDGNHPGRAWTTQFAKSMLESFNDFIF